MPNGVRFDKLQTFANATLEREQASHVQESPQGLGLQPERVERIRTQARHAIDQRPLQELRPFISRSEGLFQRTTDAWARFQPPRSLMPRSIAVVMPGTDRAVPIDGRMFEAEVRALPRNQRQEAVRNIPRLFQERVNRGFQVWNGVRNGVLTGPARTEDIRDLMTFLMVKAMERGKPFREGSFSIEDPGQRLKKFLDSCPEGYNRASSHIRDFQHLPGGGHRGIDIDLPCGHHTLLYGAMPKEGFGASEGFEPPSDRIFLKMEQHGCRLFQTSQRGDPPARETRLPDVREFLGHARGYLKTLLRTLSGGRLFPNARDSRKERIPTDIAKEYNAILRHLDRSGQKDCAHILRQNDPLKTSRGIRTLFLNLSRALNRRDLQLQQETKDRLTKLMDRLMARYDRFDVRIGNEVILDQQEILGETGPRQDARTATIRAATSLMGQALASLLDVRNPNQISAPKIQDFMDTLTKISILLGGAVGADDIADMLDESFRNAISPLADEQKAHLRKLLAASQIRNGVAAMFNIGQRTEPLANLSEDVDQLVKGIGARVLYVYSVLTINLGEEGSPLGDAVPTAKDLDTALRLLTEVAHGSLAGASAKEMLAEREAQQRLARERVGLMPITQIRRLVGEGVLAIGEEAQQRINPAAVQRETIGRTLHQEISEELNRTDRNTGLLGLNDEFLRDFFRTGVGVHGTRFGGKGTNISDEMKITQVQAFIEAVGGVEKARHISQVAYQNAFAVLEGAISQDPGLHSAWENFTSLPGDTVGHLGNVTIHVEGEGIRIHMESGQQKLAEDGRELGRNYGLDFTIQGAGTPEPVLRLDNWDVIYSSRSTA